MEAQRPREKLLTRPTHEQITPVKYNNSQNARKF